MIHKEKLDQHFKQYFSYLPKKIPKMFVSTDYETLLIDSGLQSDMFNLICSTGSEDLRSIAHSVDHFRRKGLVFCWWVGFESDPDHLIDELEKAYYS